jgi:hypothetical protein
MKAIVAIFASVGILLPTLLMMVDQMSPHGWWPRWAFYVWPTSYMLIANEGIMNARGWTVTVVSAILNALSYALVGFVVYRALQAIRPSKR